MQRLARLLARQLSEFRGERLVVAIDGPGCCGKSTLAADLERGLEAAVLHTDDFHKPRGAAADVSSPLPYRRWHEFLDAVARLAGGHAATFQPIDWRTRALAPAVTIEPRRALIVEGIGSLHQSLAALVHYRIWVDGKAITRMSRVAARDGAHEVSSWSEYVAPEQAYLRTARPWMSADLWVFGAELATCDAASSFSRRIEVYGQAVHPE